MKEATGDLWEYPADARVITTNPDVNKHGRAVMGRDTEAKEAVQRYPGIDRHFAAALSLFGNRPMILQWGPPASIISFPVKHHWFLKADLELIKASAVELVRMADKFGWLAVVVPRPGCGNGGLRWEEVRPVIEPILDERFTVIDRG